MPRLSDLIFVAAVLTAVVNIGVSAPVPDEKEKAKPSVSAEIVGYDDSVVRVELLDTVLELDTKYGVLKIPVADVHRVEFASRVPPEVEEAVAKHVADLGSPDFKVREGATETLKSLKERSYPQIVKAVSSSDPEVARRAGDAARAIKARTPNDRLVCRECDAVTTADSKFHGRLKTGGLRVKTNLFGEQVVHLYDLRSLKTGSAVAVVVAPDAPATLAAFSTQVGKELSFAVVGHDVNSPTTPGLWGTDVYSLDSHIAVAAVHAGVAQPGQKTVVTVRIVVSPPQFVGSSRNGVTSTNYGVFPSGAYEFVK